jgi:hypothetical protein
MGCNGFFYSIILRGFGNLMSSSRQNNFAISFGDFSMGIEEIDIVSYNITV